MQRLSIAALTALLSLGLIQAATNPSRQIVFPHIANGVTGSYQILTSFILTNPQREQIEVVLEFRDSQGNPLEIDLHDSTTAVPVTSTAESWTTIFIPAFETRFLETGGVGPTAVGWASATAPEGKRIGGVSA